MAQFLPKYGEYRPNTPIWDEGRSMFIMNQHESKAKHLYYTGVRLSDQIVILEYISKYYNFEYINAVEVYAFNGTDRTLIGKKEYEKEYYDKGNIRRDTEAMLYNYLKTQLKMSHRCLDDESINRQVKAFIDGSYSSMLKGNCQTLLEIATPLLKSPDREI